MAVGSHVRYQNTEPIQCYFHKLITALWRETENQKDGNSERTLTCSSHQLTNIGQDVDLISLVSAQPTQPPANPTLSLQLRVADCGVARPIELN